MVTRSTKVDEVNNLTTEASNMMHKTMITVAALALLIQSPAHAISAKYRQQLENSGCTQASELQGCDITKSKAKNNEGATVATIRTDGKEQVWVNGKQVKAKRADGALLFKQGTITFTIQGDRRLEGEDVWIDSDAGTKGPINVE